MTVLAEMNSPSCKKQRRSSAEAEVHFTKMPALQPALCLQPQRWSSQPYANCSGSKRQSFIFAAVLPEKLSEKLLYGQETPNISKIQLITIPVLFPTASHRHRNACGEQGRLTRRCTRALRWMEVGSVLHLDLTEFCLVLQLRLSCSLSGNLLLNYRKSMANASIEKS